MNLKNSLPFQVVLRLPKVIRGKDLICFEEVKRKKLTLGNLHADWTIDPDQINQNSIVYSFGIGHDISWDLALIERFGCQIHAFDPTPRSLDWIKVQKISSLFRVNPVGLAHFDGSILFYPPKDPKHVSHSFVYQADNSIEPIELKVETLQKIAQNLNHNRIDILKIDIEGAEYEVIHHLKSNPFPVRQLLIEFHHRNPQFGIAKTKTAIKTLKSMGFKIFSVSPSGEEYSFINLKY